MNPIEQKLVDEAMSKVVDEINSSMPSLDVNSYQGFDSSPLKSALTQAIQTKSARGRNNLSAQFAKLGVDGADRNNAMAQAAADEQTALATMMGDLSLKEYQSKVDAMKRAQEQWGQKYGMDMQIQQFMNESANQPNPGMYLLGQIGGVAASKYL
jgi:hypothetical protein